jgi:hypothetical protein
MPTSLLALLIILRSLIRSRIDLQLENLALMSTPLHPYATFKNSTPHFHIPSISLTFVMRPDTKMEGAFFTSDAYGTAI